MNDNKLMFSEFWEGFKIRKKMLIAIIVIITILGAGAAAMLAKTEYQANLNLFVKEPIQMTESQSYLTNQEAMYKTLVNTCSTLIQTDTQVQKAMDTVGIKSPLKSVKANLSVNQNSGGIISIGYKSKDKDIIIPFLNEVAKNSTTSIHKLLPNVAVTIIQNPASLHSVSKNKVEYAVAGAVGGFIVSIIICIGIVLLLECLDGTVKNRRELEDILDLPVLGSMPKSKER